MNTTWLIDPFRPAKGAPPQTLGAFMRWCLSGAWPALIIAAVGITMIRSRPPETEEVPEE